MVTETEKEDPNQPKEIILEKGGTKVTVDPKGVMTRRFVVDGLDILYPERIVKIGDKVKSRGGNPLLFPNAGPLPEGNEVFPNLKQHGFVRDKEWTVKSHDPEEGIITLTLTSDEQSKQLYPYDFEAELTITVDEGKLRYDLSVTNSSESSMPFAPGFHPYFQLPIERREKLKVNMPGFEPRNYDWESSLILPRQELVIANIPDSGITTIKSSPEFKRLVVWSEKDRPHLCIEPWVGDVNAILNPEQRIDIQPGDSTNLWMEIQFQKS